VATTIAQRLAATLTIVKFVPGPVGAPTPVLELTAVKVRAAGFVHRRFTDTQVGAAPAGTPGLERIDGCTED
jgi:hypothetical protein